MQKSGFLLTRLISCRNSLYRIDMNEMSKQWHYKLYSNVWMKTTMEYVLHLHVNCISKSCSPNGHMSRVVRKPAFCICENKGADQLRITAKLISIFVFATQIVQPLYFLNTKFQASNHLLWLYSPVCVRPGRKPWRPVFSQRGSYLVTGIIIFIMGVFLSCNTLQSMSGYGHLAQSQSFKNLYSFFTLDK